MKYDMERLITLYNTASPSGREEPMIRLLKAELERMGIPYYRDRKGNLYAVKGRAKTYPCVVAHMDEVHCRTGKGYAAHIVDGRFVIGYDRKRKKTAGIGADGMYRKRGSRHGLLRRLPFRTPMRPQGRQ